jgi:hypothetical protein
VIGSEFMAQFFGEYYFQLLQTLAVAPTLLLLMYTAMIPDSPVELLLRRSRPMAGNCDVYKFVSKLFQISNFVRISFF